MPPLREQSTAAVAVGETAWRKVVDGQAVVRFPRTAGRRGTITYIQVLRGAKPRPGSGLGFEGPYFRAGMWIKESELCEGRDAEAIALECGEVEGTHLERGRRRWEVVYIVWRYGAGVWTEVARTSGERTLVVPELRAIAQRALGQRAWGIVPTVAQAAEKVRRALELQLMLVEPAQRAAVLAILHDEIVTRMVEE